MNADISLTSFRKSRRSDSEGGLSGIHASRFFFLAKIPGLRFARNDGFSTDVMPGLSGHPAFFNHR
jgi:hypothetical protein